VAGAPSGDRPEVAADCVDVANAVADRLQRADVRRINVIGGHYVAIETTMRKPSLLRLDVLYEDIIPRWLRRAMART
jgi:hypothetical protein